MSSICEKTTISGMSMQPSRICKLCHSMETRHMSVSVDFFCSFDLERRFEEYLCNSNVHSHAASVAVLWPCCDTSCIPYELQVLLKLPSLQLVRIAPVCTHGHPRGFFSHPTQYFFIVVFMAFVFSSHVCLRHQGPTRSQYCRWRWRWPFVHRFPNGWAPPSGQSLALRY